MKQLEEEFGPDRWIEIGTDDEENEAERACFDHGDDSESDDIIGTSHSQAHSDDSLDNHSSRWPQSYRMSMDAIASCTPPSVNSFIKGGSFASDKRPDASATESSLLKPLLSDASVEVPTSVLPVRGSTASVLSSISEIPNHQECSYTQSVLNALNALCGIGILSTPYALKEGGWVSIVLLFMFGAITCYTGILLKRCLESSSRLQTYPDIGQAAFGLIGRICISAVLYVELYSSCVELLIMMSDNLSASFPNAEFEVAGIHLNSYQVFAITCALIILPTCWLRNLSLLSYISVGGVVTLAVVVLCLLCVSISSDVGFHASGQALNFTTLPITVGIYSFCYGSHSVFPNIYSSMKDPSRFPSVLFISFVVAGLLYSGVAVIGCLMFGEATNPQFTLNLPTNLVASKVAGWAVVVAPFTKFGLTMTPVALGLEELLPKEWVNSLAPPILIRTVLVASTLIVALTVPYFGCVMALIGSFLVMLVSVVLPCACYMRINKEKITKLQIGTCSMIMMVGVFCAIVGTYSALSRMVG